MTAVRECPRCEGVALDVVRDGGHEVDACPGCRGLWLDAHEWGGVVGPAASAARLTSQGASPGDPETAPPCPSCRLAGGAPPRLQPRLMIGAEGVVLDACPSCHGAWLDGGELPRLKKALAAGRARLATKAPSGAPPLPGASSQAATQGPTMGQAMGATAVSALGFLLQAAMRPPRRRGLFFGTRRRAGGLGGLLHLVGWLLRLLRR